MFKNQLHRISEGDWLDIMAMMAAAEHLLGEAASLALRPVRFCDQIENLADQVYYYRDKLDLRFRREHPRSDEDLNFGALSRGRDLLSKMVDKIAAESRERENRKVRSERKRQHGVVSSSGIVLDS